MCEREQYSFFAEYLPRIGTLQVAVATRESCRLRFSRRRVYKTKLGQDAGPEEEIYQLPPHIPDIDPTSCLDGKEFGPTEGPLHLRFKSRDSNISVGSKFEKLLAPQDLSSVPSARLVLRCGFCSQYITKPNHCFKRVLPLPSSEWSELAGDAFCHLHHHTSSHPHHTHTLTPHKLAPHNGDCLTSDDVICVTGECVRDKAVITNKQGAIVCRRCYTSLGVIMGGATECVEQEKTASVDITSSPLEFIRSKLSIFSTPCLSPSLTPPSPPCSPSLPPSLSPPLPPHSPPSVPPSLSPSLPPPSPSLSPSLSPPLSPLSLPSFAMCGLMEKQYRLSQRLYSAAKAKSTHRLSVEDHCGRVYVHVWMLNVISHVSSNTHVMTLQLASRFSGILPTSPPPPPPPLTHHPALKMMYVIATETDYAPWSRDSAEPLPLTEEECLWLCVLLSQSTRSLPPAQRTARGLNVRGWKGLLYSRKFLHVKTFVPFIVYTVTKNTPIVDYTCS